MLKVEKSLCEEEKKFFYTFFQAFFVRIGRVCTCALRLTLPSNKAEKPEKDPPFNFLGGKKGENKTVGAKGFREEKKQTRQFSAYEFSKKEEIPESKIAGIRMK